MLRIEQNDTLHRTRDSIETHFEIQNKHNLPRAYNTDRTMTVTVTARDCACQSADCTRVLQRDASDQGRDAHSQMRVLMSAWVRAAKTYAVS